MRPGFSLNRKLVLGEANRVEDGSGGFSEEWAPLGAIWANIDARSVTSREVAGGEKSNTKYRIIVRAAPVGSSVRPKPKQRFREGDVIFQIDAVTSANSNGLYLECWAHEEILQ